LANAIGDTNIGLESAIPNKKLRKSASELIGGAPEKGSFLTP